MKRSGIVTAGISAMAAALSLCACVAPAGSEATQPEAPAASSAPAEATSPEAAEPATPADAQGSYVIDYEPGQTVVLSLADESITFDEETLTLSNGSSEATLNCADTSIFADFFPYCEEVSSARVDGSVAGYLYLGKDSAGYFAIYDIDGMSLGTMIRAEDQAFLTAITDCISLAPETSDGSVKEDKMEAAMEPRPGLSEGAAEEAPANG